MIENTNKEFWAEVYYDRLYVFRIWKAILDDIARLDVGLRNYTSIINSSFDGWKAQGYQIYNHKRDPINPANLNYMDLHRFLQKDREVLSGPGQRLDDQKLQVLDTYIKVKYPNIAATMKSDDFTHEFASMNLKMFPRSEARYSFDDFGFQSHSGVHTSMEWSRIDQIIEANNQDIELDFPILYFHEFGKKNYCIFHRANCRVKVKNGFSDKTASHAHDTQQLHIEIADKPVRLFSGILFESNILFRDNNDRNIDLDFSAVMRERVFKTNLSSSMVFITDTRLHVGMSGDYVSCILEYFGINEGDIFEKDSNIENNNTYIEYENEKTTLDISNIYDIIEALKKLGGSM